jgi:hypothetical protein
VDAPGSCDTARNLSSSLTNFVHLSRAEILQEPAEFGGGSASLIIASPIRNSIVSIHVTIEGELGEYGALYPLARKFRLWRSIEVRNTGSTDNKNNRISKHWEKPFGAQIVAIMMKCVGVLKLDTTNARRRKTPFLISA